MSESEATKQILWNAAKQVANAGVGGALTGGLFGAGAATKSAVSYNAQMHQIGSEALQSGQYSTRLRNALQFDPSSQIGQAAIKMVNRDRISNKAAGRFVTKYDNAAVKAIEGAQNEQEAREAYARFAGSEEAADDTAYLAGTLNERLRELALQKTDEERAADRDNEASKIEKAAPHAAQEEAARASSMANASNDYVGREGTAQRIDTTAAESAPRTATGRYVRRDGTAWRTGEGTSLATGTAAEEAGGRYSSMAPAKLANTGEEVAVTDVASTDGGVTVKLSDGRTAKLDELQFDSNEERALYSMAKQFPTDKAKSFVNNYDGKVELETYTRAFNVLYDAGYQGKVSLEKAMQKFSDLPKSIRSWLQFLYLAGQNRAAVDAQTNKTDLSVQKETGSFVNELSPGSELEESLKALYEGVAAKTGQDVVLRDQIEHDANGAFNRALSQIVISDQADNKVATLIHETAEYVREYNPKGMLDLQETMLSWYAKSCDFESLADMVEHYRDLYASSLGDESTQDAMGEMYNDALSALFTDEEGVKDLLNWLKTDSGKTVEQQKSFLQTVVDLFDRLIEKITGYFKEHSLPDGAKGFERMGLDQMKAIRQQFLEAIDQAKENYDAATQQTSDGFAEVETAGKDKQEISVKMENGEEVKAERIDRSDAKYALNPDFEQQYDQWDKKDPRWRFKVGTTSEALKSIGIPDKKIIWDSGKIIKIKAKHSGMTDSVIKQVPHILESPVIIMRSKQSDSRITMFGEVYDRNEKPVLGVIELHPTRNGIAMDEFKVASAYGKDNAQRFISSSEILYVEPNKNRTHTWLRRTGLQLPVGLNQYGPIGRIARTGENVNSAASANSSIRNEKTNDIAKSEKKYSLKRSKSNGAPYMNELSYRRYSKNGAISDWGHAMFADDPYTVEMYGTNLFGVFQKDLADINDLKPEIAKAWKKTIKENNSNVLEDLDYWSKISGEEIAEQFDPTDIVETAGAWDNSEMVRWFFEETDLWEEISGVKTSDGALVWNPDIIYDIDPNSDVPGEDLVNKIFKYSLKDPAEGTPEYAEMLSKWGAIKPGHSPFRHIEVPKKTSKTKNVRQFVRTVLESNAISDDMVTDIQESVVNEAMSYMPISDKQAQETAKKLLKSGMDKAWRRWNAIVDSDSMPQKSDIALGEYLLRTAAENGDKAEVVRLTAEIAEFGTRAGQNVQALSMLKKMSGVGQLVYVQRTVETINKDLLRQFKGKAFGEVTINEKLAENLANAKTPEEVDAAAMEIYKDVADQLPPTWIDKWNAWRYLSMLGNPKTHIRNILGNAVFAPAARLKDAIGAGIEVAAIKDGERTKAVAPKQEYKEFAKKDFEQMQDIIKSGGKMNPADVIRDQMTIFKNKTLERLRKKNFELMELEDGWFLKNHYQAALAQYLQANKVNLSEISEEQLNKARAYAVEQAQKATFRDTSPVATAIQRASNANKVLSLIAEGVLPFKKTPINVLKRGVEYSPAGLLYTLSRGSMQLKRGEITASQYIDGLASGLTGTGLTALGALLYSLGWVSGGFGDDKEDEFAKLQGRQEYALRIGDKTYTIDWMAPAAIPFFIGVELMAALKGEYDDVPSRAIIDALTKIAEPMFNLSMLDGLNNTINTVSFSDNKLTAMMQEVLTSYFMQAIPSVSGQVARTADKTRRRTYIDKNSWVPESVQRAYQKLFNKIPGLSFLNQPYIDEWGREDTTQNIVVRAFENFLSPGWFSEIKTSDMEQELQRLYETTGENGVLPGYAAKYITVNGEKINLTGDEYTLFASTNGMTAYSIISEIVNSEEYTNMSDGQKVKAIKDAYEFAGAAAKAAVSDYELDGWQQDANEENQEEGTSIGEIIAHRAATNGAAPEIASILQEEGAEAAQEKLDRMMKACSSRDEMKDQKGNVKSAITRAYKKQYIKYHDAGDTEGMRKIRQELMQLRTPVGKLYTMKDFRKWIN